MAPMTILIIPPNYGDQILAFRTRHALHQKEIGTMIGVGAGAISKWERYQAAPTRKHWLALVNLMNTELASLPQPVMASTPAPSAKRTKPRLPDIQWQRLIPPAHIRNPLLWGTSLVAAASAGAFIATQILHLC